MTDLNEKQALEEVHGTAEQSPKRRNMLAEFVLVMIVGIVVVIVALALLGPATGNIFSNTLAAL